MKSKLSALKFVRNNKKQVWVMIVALSLTFMTMYIVNFLFLTTKESFKALFLEQPKRVAYLDITPATMGVEKDNYTSDDEYSVAIDKARDNMIADIKKHEGIRDAVLTQTIYASYQGIIGQVGYDFPLLSKEQIPEFLNHMGAKLIEGRMPEGDGEILVDEKVLKNKKMEVGGYFNESSYGHTFKVVGVLASDYMTCVGTPMGYTNSGWYIVVLCDEANADMTKVLKDIGITPTEYDTMYDCVDWADMYEELVTKQLDAALLAILIVVVIFLAISILVAYVSFMRSRVNEYCLYTSIGFGRKDVYGMIMREIVLIFGISIILGGIVTVIIMIYLGSFVLEPMGLIYKYFYPEHLLRILAAFVAIVGALQIPISVTINNIKTIDMIEE
ncbi:MAG: ABC transporter permease [Lachnospira sp.]|nr:ABC transporter permease [Lachnospira sp.]